jgi:hypothetical protein
MDSSTSPEFPNPHEPRETQLDTVAAQTAAIDELVGLAEHKLQVFDVDLSTCGWNTAKRADLLGAFFRRNRAARLELILHDTRWLESSCPRLMTLVQRYAYAITIYRTGPEARVAMDPLVIADGSHYLHRFHIDQPRAAFAIEKPQEAKPLVTRFEEIWATGEPGITGTVLGL